MKLSEIRGDKALDALADLIDPITEIVSDEEVQKIHNSDAPMIALVKPIVKNHKKAITTILAILDGADPETYEVSLLTLPKKVLEILNDEEVTSLFKSQGQNTEEASSGSASENIGA